jgi:hypothetical protein
MARAAAAPATPQTLGASALLLRAAAPKLPAGRGPAALPRAAPALGPPPSRAPPQAWPRAPRAPGGWPRRPRQVGRAREPRSAPPIPRCQPGRRAQPQPGTPWEGRPEKQVLRDGREEGPTRTATLPASKL